MSDWREKLADLPVPHTFREVILLVLDMAEEDAAALEEVPPNTSARSEFRERTGYDLYDLTRTLAKNVPTLPKVSGS